jgi:hypothetical protein
MKIHTNKRRTGKRFFLLFILLASFSLSSQAQTRSFKRGVGYNNLSRQDVEALAPGLSWGYNWGHTGSGNDAAFAEFGVEYVPMAWNGVNKNTIRNYLQNHPEIKYILGFNEPNFKDQANLSPTTAAARWKDVEEIADEFNLTIVGPALNYSPDAPYQDPIKWYDEFFEACKNCRVDHIAVHFYMPAASAIQSNVAKFKKYGKPIWLTEFCAWESNTGEGSQKRFLMETLDYLETDPDVFRYAWFKERGWNNAHPYMQLLDIQSGVLKDLGEIFTYMSSYDDNFYFTTNRRIPAEHYIRMKGIQLEKTADESDHLNITEFDPGYDYADYNVNISEAGEYNLFFRIAFQYGDVSEVKVSVNDQEKGSMVFANQGIDVWNTQQCKATLAAGKQKIRISFKRGGCKINWWAISKNETPPTAIDEIAATADLSVYPNPVIDKLYLKNGAKADITVFDVSGKKVAENASASFVDLSVCKAGVYLVTVQTKTGERLTHKIIKN